MLIKNLSKSFDTLKVLNNLNFDVEDGEILCIIGSSGCGKSTLLRILAGLEPYEGEICNAEGQPLLIFQEFDQLLPWKTVYGNIEFGLKLRNEEDYAEKINDMVKLVGLKGFEEYYPHHLSGGMKQRVAIARALVLSPSMLLMDEPFGSLDAQMRRRLQHELVQLWQKIAMTIVFVTHNIRESIILGSRIMVLSRKGEIKEVVKVNLSRPRDPSTHNFGNLWLKMLSFMEVN